MRTTSIMLAGALAVAVLPCHAIIQIDNYLYAGVSSSEDIGEPDQPWLEGEGLSSSAWVQTELSGTEVVGGMREFRLNTNLNSGDSVAGVIGVRNFGVSNEQGLIFTSEIESGSGMPNLQETITYGRNGNFQTQLLDIDVVDYFGGVLPSDGGFLLNIQGINVVEGSLSLTLSLSSPTINGESSSKVFSANSGEDVFWSFDEFSITDFSDLTQIGLTFSSGDVTDVENYSYGTGSLVASSFSIVGSTVPEPSTYALIFGLMAIGVLTVRKRFATNSKAKA